VENTDVCNNLQASMKFKKAYKLLERKDDKWNFRFDS